MHRVGEGAGAGGAGADNDIEELRRQLKEANDRADREADRRSTMRPEDGDTFRGRTGPDQRSTEKIYTLKRI